MSQQQITGRFIAAVSIVALLLSAFPASFFVAEAEGDIVPTPDGGFSGEVLVTPIFGCTDDSAINYDLEATADDYSFEYLVIEPELVDITICKYEYDSETRESYPVSDWTVYLYADTSYEGELSRASFDGPEHTLLTEGEEGEEGCVSQAVNPEEGPWFAYEEMQEGWSQNSVGVTSGVLLGERYVAEYCQFFGEAISDDELSSASRVASPRCDFYNDDDREEPPRRSSGGGSGTRVKDRATQGVVLGAATSTPQCGMYLNDYMRQGKATSSTEVTKLQIFLNAVGIKLEVTGAFDTATDAAVRGFQAQHKAEVLTPWYLAKIVPHENPTGWVYQLTRWKINNIVCPGSEAYPVLN